MELSNKPKNTLKSPRFSRTNVIDFIREYKHLFAQPEHDLIEIDMAIDFFLEKRKIGGWSVDLGALDGIVVKGKRVSAEYLLGEFAKTNVLFWNSAMGQKPEYFGGDNEVSLIDYNTEEGKKQIDIILK